jgi:hypothetical protein
MKQDVATSSRQRDRHVFRAEEKQIDLVVGANKGRVFGRNAGIKKQEEPPAVMLADGLM